MARILTNTLIADLSSRLPDNETGIIMPADVRQVIADVVESLRPAYSLLTGLHEAAPLTASLNNSTWTKITPVGLFTVAKNSDVNELEASIAQANITTKYGNFVHFFSAQFTVSGPNGRILDLAIGYNLQPINPFTTIELLGNNTWQNLSTATSGQPPVGSQLELLGKWFGGAATDNLTIVNVKLLGELSTSRYI